MKKRMLSILLTLCMVLSIAPAAVFAEGGTAPADITGSGASDDPYLIYTAAGLKQFRDIVNGENGKIMKSDAHAKLMNDIVLNDGTFDKDGNYTPGASGKDAEEWTPIGWFETIDNNYPYTGTFDGGGYTIKGLYVNNPKGYAGLFGYIKFYNTSSSIQNITVEGYVSGYYAGGIVGRSNGVRLLRCTNRAVVSGAYYSGGMIGYLRDQFGAEHKLELCFNAGEVLSPTKYGYTGGLIGYLSPNLHASITNCANAAKLTGKNVGGLIGYASKDADVLTIKNCYSTAQFNADAARIGGIVGWPDDDLKVVITNSYWLEGTAEGVSYEDHANTTLTNVEAKSKAEFADGTVLGLLQGGDASSPWAKTGYVTAAGMEVPLMSWQTADSHTHDTNGLFGGCTCGYATCDGTADHPYLIYNAADLKAFRDLANGGKRDAHAKLMNDITLNDGTFDKDGNWSKPGTPDKWTPIGRYTSLSVNTLYSGTFDGNNKTIHGLYVKDEQYAGLFGSVSGGTVKNVAVTGYVEGTEYVGGIVGYVKWRGTITDCTNHAAVKAKNDKLCVGGIVGCVYWQGTITGCTNTGAVTAFPIDGSSYYGLGSVGGIVGGATTGSMLNSDAISITACANLGEVSAFIDSDQAEAHVGGIAGEAAYRTIPADCFNAGDLSITERNATCAPSSLGGIVGLTGDAVAELPEPYTSNCYSVGTLTHTGSGQVTIRGIAQDENRHSITNCYWLDGTAESGIGDPRPSSYAAAKSKAEFADGTVLDLLKGNRTDSPWADECQYVAAAGMTLPVFKGQGDSHTHSEKTGNCLDGIYCECGYLMHGATSGHNWGEWQHLTTSHSRTCNNPGCGVTQSGNCSGGTATCTEKATCEVCGGKYGEPDPDNHTGRLEWTQTATGHRQEWSCCHVETVAEENHEWENGVCSECHYTCAHTGGTATCTDKAVCEICGEKYGAVDPDNHTDITEWIQTETKHTQKYKCCGAVTVTEEDHEWENGICKKCGYGCRHDYEWQSENGQYWQKCKFCDHETAKKDIPTINIIGADKVCRTQDYKFSFTLPVGATDAAYGYEFIGLVDGSLTPTVENGLYSGSIKASVYPAEENSFKLIVSAKTTDGFAFSAEKTVTIQNEHTGGTATCTEQATCEICGEKYGDLKPHSYSPDWSTDETNHWHECTECRAKKDEAEHTDTNKDHQCDICEKVLSDCTDTDKNHKCDLCGKELSEHTGGTATCKDKAICEICGESYGELKANNHADMKHTDAKAATKTAEGNTEYWYCEDCGKYFADKYGTKEITKADTVTAKLPDDSKSPQTGDNSNLLLWIALLFISGGAVTATTVYGRKKKRSVK